MFLAEPAKGQHVPPAKRLTIDDALSKAKKAVRLHQPAVAAELYGAVLRQQPNHPVAKKALRKLERQLGQGSPSRVTATEPGPEPVNELVSLMRLGQMEQVEQTSKTLLRDYPQSVLLLNLLGIALQRQSKLSQAVEVLDKAIELKPDVPESYTNRGIALNQQGHPEEALASFDKAIDLKPDFAEAYFNRGNVLQGIGRINEASASYEKAIAIRRDFAAAHRGLSALKNYVPDDAQIDLMERLFGAADTSDADRMELGFALAKAHEDLGNVDMSFDYLTEGNRLRKQVQRYDIEDDRRLFSQIKRLFAEPSPSRLDAKEQAASIQPLFIVGMLRSGTSLTEQILASHSQVHGAGELDTMTTLASAILSDVTEQEDDKKLSGLSNAKSSLLRGAYLDALHELGFPEKVVTDKMPLNFRWIGFILSAFPAAKIIHVKRDPMATCWSIYKHYFPNPCMFAYDLDDLAQFYMLYVDLMAFWRERYPNSIYDLEYERLTENQQVETRKLLAFCGLEWEDQCLDFHETERQVRTMSATKVRNQMYTGSSDAWKEYEHRLKPLIAGLDYRGS